MSTSQWKKAPPGDRWTDAANWKSGLVPTTIAVFGASSQATVHFSADSNAEIESICFAEDAPSYTFTINVMKDHPALTIGGAGVENRSLSPQSFIVTSPSKYGYPQLRFTGSASAGGETVSYYAGPESLETSFGGATIDFCDDATAGSAGFTVRTGKRPPPSCDFDFALGGQVIFWHRATAGTATFKAWGTIGSDPYTFASVVFHDEASAGDGTFFSQGGTLGGCDGGNIQFYDHSTAAQGLYLNYGGTDFNPASGKGANGGDVAFCGSSTGGNGRFNNFPARKAGAHGGGTSFNNNPNHPPMGVQAASAGHGTYLNFGATAESPGGGGHTEFTAQYGNATAGHANIHNFGSALAESAGAGHTMFSVGDPYGDDDNGDTSSGSQEFFSSAGNSTIWNYPGAAGGFTVFKSFGNDQRSKAPTAANAILHNLGGDAPGLAGGYTWFKGQTTAGDARLIAYGGTGGGQGGQILFSDRSSGESASIQLIGTGALDIGSHNAGLVVSVLELTQGIIKVYLGADAKGLTVTGRLTINSSMATQISFPKNGTITEGVEYTLLQAPSLSDFGIGQFVVDGIGNAEPTLSIDDDVLTVIFRKTR